MQRAKCQDFIDNEIKELYPKWQPTQKAGTLWCISLMPFEWDTVKRALNISYTKFSGNVPRLDKILELCRLFQPKKADCADSEPILAYTLERIDGKVNDRRKYFLPRGPLPGDMTSLMNEAEEMRKKHERTYGGQWITIRPKIS